MKFKVFSVRDSKVDAFMRPFFAQTTGEGLRIWEDSVKSEGSGFQKHPDDYCLFEIGEFDSEKGLLSPLLQPMSLGLACEYVRSKNYSNMDKSAEIRNAQ